MVVVTDAADVTAGTLDDEVVAGATAVVFRLLPPNIGFAAMVGAAEDVITGFVFVVVVFGGVVVEVVFAVPVVVAAFLPVPE